MPPQDTYFKLMHTLEEVNGIIAANTPTTLTNKPQRISPELGNVCFASGQHGWSFTLKSFAHMYVARHSTVNSTADVYEDDLPTAFGKKTNIRGGSKHNHTTLQPEDLAKRLWGDWYFDADRHAFSKKNASNAARTFIVFILEPLYKIYSQVIGENPEDLSVVMKQLGVPLKQKELHLDPKPLLKLVCARFFGYPRGFVEMVLQHVPSPAQAAAKKVALNYSGYQTSSIAQAMKACSTEGPLMINVVKVCTHVLVDVIACH